MISTKEATTPDMAKRGNCIFLTIGVGISSLAVYTFADYLGGFGLLLLAHYSIHKAIAQGD